MNVKIAKHHLERKAIVYLRQSSMSQVERNHESTERQYALRDRAMGLGWDQSQIVLLDGDLGKTGTSTEGRSDFQELIAKVSIGAVGAVLALEVSRFSRSQADWHHLVDICALTDTLIIDHDGVYDPNDFNDRVLLGFKGTWSHTELHGMKIRLQGAKRHKAKRGALRCKPPIGYEYGEDGRLGFYADEGVTACVRLVFRKFSELKSAYGVVTYFAKQGIKFPKYSCYRIGSYKVIWGELTYCRVLSMLKSPTYAGAYFYGRTTQRSEIVDGQVVKRKHRFKNQDEWTAFRQEAHPGFVTWEEFQANLEILKANDQQWDSKGRHGSAKRGWPLLQGLVLCGRCGRRMRVRYQGDGGSRPYYVCCGSTNLKAAYGVCWGVVNSFVDQAFIEHLFATLNAENLDLSLQILGQVSQDLVNEEDQWRIMQERAEYEADRAFRQYDAVEPENRLAARGLEARWNEKLRDLEALRARNLDRQRSSLHTITEEQRREILSLARDFRSIWSAKTTTQVDRKQILDLLIKQIALSPVDVPRRQCKISILWHSGAVTTTYADRPKGNIRNRTSPEALAKIRELVDTHTDRQIAAALNKLGIPALHEKFTEGSVGYIRQNYGIKKPGSDPTFSVKGIPYKDHYLSINGLATRLNIDRQVINYWRKRGILQGFQTTKKGPWWIKVNSKDLEEMKTKMRRVKIDERLLHRVVEECAE